MPRIVPDLSEAQAALLPPCLTAEQRERYAGIAAIVKATTDRLPRTNNEFVEPASVFEMQVRLRKPRG